MNLALLEKRHRKVLIYRFWGYIKRLQVYLQNGGSCLSQTIVLTISLSSSGGLRLGSGTKTKYKIDETNVFKMLRKLCFFISINFFTIQSVPKGYVSRSRETNVIIYMNCYFSFIRFNICVNSCFIQNQSWEFLVLECVQLVSTITVYLVSILK